MVGGVEGTGTPPGLDYHGDGGERRDQPVALQET
jgi:hypothetical protein